MEPEPLSAETEATLSLWLGSRRPQPDQPAWRTEQVTEQLEEQVRATTAELITAGLDEDEAVLIALRRVTPSDEPTNRFVVDNLDRLWPESKTADPANPLAATPEAEATEVATPLVIAVAAGLVVTTLINLTDNPVLGRTIPTIVLAFVAVYFVWREAPPLHVMARVVAGFVAGVAAAALYPFTPALTPGRHTSHTGELVAVHLPLMVWFLVGVVYTGHRWRDPERRMDFVRLTGEIIIYYVLIALGGLVLLALTFGVFESLDIFIDDTIEELVLPTGAAGAAVISAWLAASRQGVAEAMAPMLTKVFTPLFTILFIVVLITLVVTGQPFEVDRDLLIILDLMLAVVLGLVLYAVSAREPSAEPGWSDRLQLALIGSAMAMNLVGLVAIIGRIGEFGFTPNKTAALGENLILAVNLGYTGWLYTRFLAGRAEFNTIERWQTSYLVVFPIWAAIVVFLFPPMVGFR